MKKNSRVQLQGFSTVPRKWLPLALSSSSTNMAKHTIVAEAQPAAVRFVTAAEGTCGTEASTTATAQSAADYYASIVGTEQRGWSGHTSLAAEAVQLESRDADRGAPAASQPGWNAAAWQERERNKGASYPGVAAERGIGYELLQKAGWKEGSGLGAQEQGIAAPIAAWYQSGRMGIGIGATPPQPTSTLLIAAAATGSKKTHATAGKDAAQQTSSIAAVADELHRRPPKRGWETVRVEEALEAKVKRIRQVMQAEVDDEVSKAIDRYIFRAFRDDNTDTNPLLRRNNLSASNPLL